MAIISTLGAGSGLELRDILTQFREVDEAPITRLESKKTAAEERLVKYDEVGAKLYSIKSHALKLSLSSEYLKRDLSISDEEVLGASSITGTAVGSHNVEVKNLAIQNSWMSSNGFDSKTESVVPGDAVFSYTIGTGDAVEVDLETGDTLEDIASKINEDEDNAGITAQVIDDGTDGTPYYLVLTAKSTGEDNRITSISGLDMTEKQGAGVSLNAEVEVNGIKYERQTNTSITNIIQGVTLDLKKIGTSNISITANQDFLKTEVTALVEAYNEASAFIKENTAFNYETKSYGPMGNSYSMTGLTSQLDSLMGSSIQTGTSITSLYQVGLEMNKDGTISLNEKTFDDAIASDYDNIKGLFLGDEDNGIIGLADTVNDAMLNLTAYDGLLEAEKTATEDEIKRIGENVTFATQRLDKKYEEMTQRFVQLDMEVARLQSESAYMTSVFDSINGKKES